VDAHPFVVALTGGVASGKSTAAALLASLGTAVNDADVAARQLVAPGSAAIGEIAAAFGRSVLEPDGSLDRGAMREIVFGDDAQRRKLEAILHPRVREALLDSVRRCREPYCVLVIPLLAESYDSYRFVDRVLVVDASPATQLARLMTRDSASAEQATRMMAAQASRDRRLAIADDVIDNDGAARNLDSPLQRLHQMYLRLASRQAVAAEHNAQAGRSG
jgi:dephospho-CoA kinase